MLLITTVFISLFFPCFPCFPFLCLKPSVRSSATGFGTLPLPRRRSCCSSPEQPPCNFRESETPKRSRTPWHSTATDSSRRQPALGGLPSRRRRRSGCRCCHTIRGSDRAADWLRQNSRATDRERETRGSANLPC